MNTTGGYYELNSSFSATIFEELAVWTDRLVDPQ